jgi:hypothetical protein
MQNLRVIGQAHLLAKEYNELMMDKIDDTPKSWFKALEDIEKEKVKIAKAYNKRVMEKSFQVGDLVWKTILPLGTRSGHLARKHHLELSGLCRLILTSWKTLKDTYCQKLWMVSTWNDIILACGKTGNGDYCVKVDYWYKEAWTVNGNHLV